MSKGLEALKNHKLVLKALGHKSCEEWENLKDIEQELKALDKIKATLAVINMKLTSKREECVENIDHTEEDDYVHEASEAEIRCIDWFRQLLKEVLL